MHNIFPWESFNVPTDEKKSENYMIIPSYSLDCECKLHPAVVARLVKVCELYEPRTKIILTGKRPPEFLKPDRCMAQTEASAMAGFLVEQGIPKDNLLLEESSLTTFMNAYYSRLQYLDRLSIKRVKIISNRYHLPLVTYCFDLVFGREIAFEVVTAPDDGFTSNELKLWSDVIKRITTQIYPVLFRGIQGGDMDAITQVIDSASSLHPDLARIRFESAMRPLLGLQQGIRLLGLV